MLVKDGNKYYTIWEQVDRLTKWKNSGEMPEISRGSSIFGVQYYFDLIEIIQQLKKGDLVLITGNNFVYPIPNGVLYKNGDVYKYDGRSLSLIGNIKGGQGIQGIQGIQGEQGEKGEQGIPGPSALYLHNIKITAHLFHGSAGGYSYDYADLTLFLTIPRTTNELFTAETLRSYIGTSPQRTCSGYFNTNNMGTIREFNVISVYAGIYDIAFYFNIFGLSNVTGVTYDGIRLDEITDFVDTVTTA